MSIQNRTPNASPARRSTRGAPRSSLAALVALAGLTSAGGEVPGTRFPAATYGPGTNPEVAVIADLNGDGLGDLIVGNSSGGANPSLRVALSLGNGVIGPFVTYSNSPFIRDLDVADLDGDGDLDLVVAQQGSSVTVRLGSGDGTLGAPMGNGITGEPWGVAIVDLDGDQVLDLAVANRSMDTVHALLGVGDGTFGAPTSYACGTDPLTVAAADLNGDSVPDLAVANSASDDVSILLGVGDGTFGAASTLPMLGSATAVALGDFDEDGAVDLAVSVNAAQDVVSVFAGLGDGTFGAVADLPLVDTVPIDVAAVDLDDDGHLDLVTSCSGRGEVMLGHGDGTFDPSLAFPTAADRRFGVGDLSGDGILDLAFAGRALEQVSVLIGNGDGTMEGAEHSYSGTAVGDPRRVDMNGDGHLDLIYRDATGFWVAAGDGNGNYAPAVLSGTGVSGQLVFGDLNEDGALDVIVGTGDFGQDLLIALGVGDGTLGPVTAIPLGTTVNYPRVGDFDGDQHLDVVLEDSWVEELYVLPGNGDGTFGTPIVAPINQPTQDAKVADLDNDQNLDVVFVDFGGRARAFLGNGDGTFAPEIVTSVGSGTQPNRIDVADFDSDGNIDIATAGTDTGDARILFGNGDGTFGSLTTYSVSGKPLEQGVGDVDADGTPDFVVSTSSGLAHVFLSNGNGSFTRSSHIGGANDPSSLFDILLTDFDEDGAIDIVGRSGSELGLSVLFQQSGLVAPMTYCTPKTSSAGCVTAIAASSASAPTSGAGDFTLDAVDVQEGMNGLLFTSVSGAAALPFNGGTLCMNPPLKRGPIQNSGGSMPGGCAGSFSTVVNDGLVIPLGLDAGPGNQAHYQYFYRDPGNGPGALGSALSDAIAVCFL